MNAIRRLSAAVLTGAALVAPYLATTAAIAARPIPIPERYGGPVTTPATTTVVTHGGSPWWVFVLVAVASSALTVAANVAIARRRHTHLRPLTRVTAADDPAPGVLGEPARSSLVVAFDDCRGWIDLQAE